MAKIEKITHRTTPYNTFQSNYVTIALYRYQA